MIGLYVGLCALTGRSNVICYKTFLTDLQKHFRLGEKRMFIIAFKEEPCYGFLICRDDSVFAPFAISLQSRRVKILS